MVKGWKKKRRNWSALNGLTLLRVNEHKIHPAVYDFHCCFFFLHFFKDDQSASQKILCNTYEWKIHPYLKKTPHCDLLFLTHFLSGASSVRSMIECGILVGSIKTHTLSQEVSVSPAAKATFKCGRSPWVFSPLHTHCLWMCACMHEWTRAPDRHALHLATWLC